MGDSGAVVACCWASADVLSGLDDIPKLVSEECWDLTLSHRNQSKDYKQPFVCC